jgi:putative ABC transport system permease protein
VVARLHPADLLRVGAAGLRTRPLRAVLSALGIGIGIAVMVAVVGITSSGRADLDRTLERLGTNLLRVGAGQQSTGGAAQLSVDAEAMISRIGPVTNVSAVGTVTDARVYRTDRVPVEQSNGIAVVAARLNLPADVGITVGHGTWLTEATSHFPTVVLGDKASKWLGVTEPDTQVWLGDRWFTVIGVLDPVPLAEELDAAALIGWDAAINVLGFDGHPSTVYVRSRDESVSAVRAVLARTADPAHPDQVRVSRPSDALTARAAADRAFAGLLLGLGAVALLVGGIGVANTMVISVLERRAEIGLRRALGARRGQIRVQFVVESLLLSALGGSAGAALGIAATAAYAAKQGWPTLVPPWASFGGLGATLVIGAIAGLYPAVRAAGVPPTEALAT